MTWEFLAYLVVIIAVVGVFVFTSIPYYHPQTRPVKIRQHGEESSKAESPMWLRKK
jgi:hypothetical protein